MILAWLLLLTGLTISSVAIYYSVVGLTAIFSAAAVPIMVMGVSLEVAKLVCATWIKAHWSRVPRLMKTYMCVAVVVLMLITSMGIFGFLSKAHNDQNLVSGDVGAKLAIYDEKIKTAKDNIETDRKQLAQMDAAVDQVMGRSSDEKGADKANAIRNSQKRDRATLARDIETNQKIIATVNEEAAPVRAENRKVEAEVGPIKYIAAFLYGVAPDATMLERAVTWIIIMIVVVFDPLAVIMLLAAQMTFAWNRKETDAEAHERIERELEETMQDLGIVKKPPSFLDKLKDIKDNILKKPQQRELKIIDDGTPNYEGVRMPNGEWVQTGPSFGPQEPQYAPDDGPLTDEQIEQINAMLAEYAEHAETELPEPEIQFELNPEEIDEEESPFRGRGTAPGVPMTASYLQPKLTEELKEDLEEPKEDLEEPEVEEPVQIPPELEQLGTTWTPATQQDADEAVQQLKDIGFLTETGEINPDYIPNEDIEPEIPEAVALPDDPEPEPIPEAQPGRNRGVDMSKVLATAVTGIQADNQPVLGNASNTGFGNEYPANPAKGDIYLRTDYLPNRLFKFNGSKWIEVDKTQTDVYAYDDLYIQHLISEIDAGRYDPDQLSDVERQQIQQYLEKNA
jgi:Tfp pilus assembly protein PilO